MYSTSPSTSSLLEKLLVIDNLNSLQGLIEKTPNLIKELFLDLISKDASADPAYLRFLSPWAMMA